MKELYKKDNIKKAVDGIDFWITKNIEKQYDKAFNKYLALIAFDSNKEDEYYTDKKTVTLFWNEFHKTEQMINDYKVLK